MFSDRTAPFAAVPKAKAEDEEALRYLGVTAASACVAAGAFSACSSGSHGPCNRGR